MQPPLYDPNVPEKPSDSLADSQTEFLANFLGLYNSFMVNHVPLDAVANRGNHNFIELIEQPTTPQTDIGEVSVFTKDDPSTTDQIFIKYQGNPGQEFQYTCYQIYSVNSKNSDSFFTFLPGRIIMYFGVAGILNTKDEINQLRLSPPIATNIITVGQCPLGNPPNTTIQTADPIKNEKNFFDRIKFGQQTLIPISNLFYVILANI